MVQFKSQFLHPPSRRASDSVSGSVSGGHPHPTRVTTVQKCVRAGGKHNDLDNVGKTARHLTFFEMLGNFTFGECDKRVVIEEAWIYLTRVLNIPASRLMVTVHVRDTETYDIWLRDVKVNAAQIQRVDSDDNYWRMGDGDGPCGYCTEIFFDRQHSLVDNDRYVELWNLVFMQYQVVTLSAEALMVEGKRQAASRSAVTLPLHPPSVDTGMGLERVAAVVQGVTTNYDIDSMLCIVNDIVAAVNRHHGVETVQYVSSSEDQHSVCVRVIADHLRSSVVMICDGVIPSNTGRGYVLRRIIRRAALYVDMLGIHVPFLSTLYPSVIQSLGGAYPDLCRHSAAVQHVLQSEESLFLENLKRGLALFNAFVKECESGKGDASPAVIPAETVFHLYDTYGFPLDLSYVLAAQHNLGVDTRQVEELMAQQRQQSRHARKDSATALDALEAANPNAGRDIQTVFSSWQNKGIHSAFTGYNVLTSPLKNGAMGGETLSPPFDSVITAVAPLTESSAWLSIHPCPFYATGGGQVGDRGKVQWDEGGVGDVVDVISPYSGGIAVKINGTSASTVSVGTRVQLWLDIRWRHRCSSHHTATHLLHAALRRKFGMHIIQAGSYVGSDKLSFDFGPCHSGLDDECVHELEHWISNIIISSYFNGRDPSVSESPLQVQSSECSLSAAVASNAIGLFNDRYAATVRVVSIGDVSREICGGTHVSVLYDLFPFKIINYQSIAAGVKRIEAVAGDATLDYFNQKVSILNQTSKILKVSHKDESNSYEERINKLLADQKNVVNENKRIKSLLFDKSITMTTLSTSADVGRKGDHSGNAPVNVCIYHAQLPASEHGIVELLRERVEARRHKDDAIVIGVFASSIIIALPSTQRYQYLSAGDLLSKFFHENGGGSGGGKSMMAQGRSSTLCSRDLVNALQQWLQ